MYWMRNVASSKTVVLDPASHEYSARPNLSPSSLMTPFHGSSWGQEEMHSSRILSTQQGCARMPAGQRIRSDAVVPGLGVPTLCSTSQSTLSVAQQRLKTQN